MSLEERVAEALKPFMNIDAAVDPYEYHLAQMHEARIAARAALDAVAEYFNLVDARNALRYLSSLATRPPYTDDRAAQVVVAAALERNQRVWRTE